MTLRTPDGVLITTPDDGSRESQNDTVQCCHCGRHWVVDRLFRDAIQGKAGFCTRCNHITCPGELCNYECVPQEQMLENMEKGVLNPRTYRPIVVAGFRNADKIQ
jgi:hypothetical protein